MIFKGKVIFEILLIISFMYIILLEIWNIWINELYDFKFLNERSVVNRVLDWNNEDKWFL